MKEVCSCGACVRCRNRAWKARRREAGLCMDCATPTGGTYRCETCMIRNRERRRRPLQRDAARHEALMEVWRLWLSTSTVGRFAAELKRLVSEAEQAAAKKWH